MKISLSENISKYRKNNKMTQEDLAEALGVTFAAVSKWERGVATPDLELIIQWTRLRRPIFSNRRLSANNRLINRLTCFDALVHRINVAIP